MAALAQAPARSAAPALHPASRVRVARGLASSARRGYSRARRVPSVASSRASSSSTDVTFVGVPAGPAPGPRAAIAAPVLAACAGLALAFAIASRRASDGPDPASRVDDDPGERADRRAAINNDANGAGRRFASSVVPAAAYRHAGRRVVSYVTSPTIERHPSDARDATEPAPARESADPKDDPDPALADKKATTAGDDQQQRRAAVITGAADDSALERVDDDEQEPVVWDAALDSTPYPPAASASRAASASASASNATTDPSSSSSTSPAERRASERRRRRDAYFKNASSVSLVGGRDARIREEAFLGRALAPERATLASRVFESSRMAPGAYAHAFARVCRELELGDVRGEGTFSDVYETRARRGRDENVRTFFADSASKSSAVIKCSVPFPGVVGGRTLGDGLGVGECEAGALAAMPAHPRVVEMLAAFLSADRNESYLLLADAGRCLHAARVEGEVTPLDARRHSRAVFEALAHCHAHGVVHRDVKAGNVLVSERSDASSAASEEDFAVLIDFGVAKRPGVVDPEPPSRYGTPGYQAPELLMTDMRDAEADASGGRWFAVDIFALGCAMFFLCEGKELFGEPDRSSSEDPLGAYGARTKTKARTQAEQEALEDAMARGDTFEPFVGENSDISGSEKKARATKSRGFTTIDRRDRETFGGGGGGSETHSAFDLGSGKLAPAFLRALRRDVAVAAAEAELREAETDAAVLRAMAEFPGYEPRSDAESAFVAEMLGKRAVPAPPPRGRETLERFVARKLGKRQPAAFCALVAACLARDPTRRPTAREALEWPGAWEGVVGGFDFDAEEGVGEEEEEEEEEREKEAPGGAIEGAREATGREGGPSIEDGAGGDAADGGAAAGRKSETCVDVV